MIRQPNVVPIDDKYYQLMEDYIYQWKRNNIWTRINIACGFTYDGASVPRVLWSLSGYAKDGLHRAASLVHDFIYHFDGVLPIGTIQQFDGVNWCNCNTFISRKECDRLFFDIMIQSGIPYRYARRLWFAVVVGGFFLW